MSYKTELEAAPYRTTHTAMTTPLRGCVLTAWVGPVSYIDATRPLVDTESFAF